MTGKLTNLWCNERWSYDQCDEVVLALCITILDRYSGSNNVIEMVEALLEELKGS